MSHNYLSFLRGMCDSIFELPHGNKTWKDGIQHHSCVVTLKFLESVSFQLLHFAVEPTLRYLVLIFYFYLFTWTVLSLGQHCTVTEYLTKLCCLSPIYTSGDYICFCYATYFASTKNLCYEYEHFVHSIFFLPTGVRCLSSLLHTYQLLARSTGKLFTNVLEGDLVYAVIINAFFLIFFFYLFGLKLFALSEC